MYSSAAVLSFEVVLCLLLVVIEHFSTWFMSLQSFCFSLWQGELDLYTIFAIVVQILCIFNCKMCLKAASFL